ncbi:hypothetical protein ACFCV3_28860 [Kribbella sp. NPDC056345]|uniref:hypothetical protein n=1 Tax=Kribbella sp. NPDC056345 TaxID=3345789 RepID=UPI0035E25F83
MAKQDRGGIGLKLALGSALVILLTAVGLLLLRCTKPGVWNELTSNQSLANAVITIGGSIMGAGIAVLLAYGILRAQIVADRTLAADSHALEVIHDVAGELAVWVAGFTKPKPTSGGKTKPVSTGSDAAIRALTSRRDFLASAGIMSSDDLLAAIQQLESDRIDIVEFCDSIERRGSTPEDVGSFFSLGIDVSIEADSEWKKVEAEVVRLSSHVRDLAIWSTGLEPPSYKFEHGTRISSMVEIEMRLVAKGHQISRDEWQVWAGSYDAYPDSEGDNTKGSP